MYFNSTPSKNGRSSSFRAAVSSTSSSSLLSSFVTPSPNLNAKKRTKVKNCSDEKNKKDNGGSLKQTTLTQILPFYEHTCSPSVVTAAVKNTNASQVVTDKIKQENNKDNAASIDLTDYSSDDAGFLSKAAQVVEHNKVIAKEMRQLERLCELRELPFFSLEEMKPHYPLTQLGEDPRGWRPRFEWQVQPAGLCQHCHCSFPNCHKEQFGFYCELSNVQFVDLQESIGTLGEVTEEDIKDVLKRAYNEYLCIRLFESRRLLDANKAYSPPKCLEESISFARSYQYFQFTQMNFLWKSRVKDDNDNENNGMY